MSITIRQPPQSSHTPVPKDWLAGNLRITHALDAIGAMAPTLESFVIRSVQRMKQYANSPNECEAIRCLVTQETNHSREHRQFMESLEREGIPITPHLEALDRALRQLEERYSAHFCLAVTAALEHLTVSLASTVVSRGIFLEANPTPQALWLWHAVEEMEHKAVAYNLLQRVGCSWFLRINGLFVGYAIFWQHWKPLTLTLIREDPDATEQRMAADGKAWFGAGRPKLGPVLVSNALPYLLPGFHPNDIDHSTLIDEALAIMSASGEY